MAQMPIPETDSLEYCRFSICWPNTPAWRAILRGFVSTPVRGRFWDASTGSIQDVQAVGQDILDQNPELVEVLLSCDDGQEVIQALQEIAGAITSVGGNNSTTAIGCCPGGTDVMPEDWVGGSTPPNDFLEPTGGPATSERICTVATLIFNYLENSLQAWISSGVQTIITASGIAGTAVLYGLVGAGISFVVTPGFIFDDILLALIGAVTGIVTAMTSGGVDLPDLLSAIQTNRDDVICAIQSGTDNATIRSNVDQVLIDAGVTPANRAVIAAMLIAYVLNLTHFDPQPVQNAFENALEELGPLTCTCDCGPFTILFGTLQSGDLSSGEFTIASEQRLNDGNPYHEVNILGTEDCCEIVQWDMSANPVPGCLGAAGIAWRDYQDCNTGIRTTITEPALYPIQGQSCQDNTFGNRFASCSPFTVTFTRLGIC